MQHLDRFFTGRRIAAIGQPVVDAYIVRRQEETPVGATIRRELRTLTKMLRLAYENGKLVRLPILHKPKEGPPREGFFERRQLDLEAGTLPLEPGTTKNDEGRLVYLTPELKALLAAPTRADPGRRT